MSTNAELPDRQTPRMQNYDYSDPGYYCVTICIRDQRKLLGKIADGKMYPNSVGQTIQRIWETLTKRFAHVELDEFMLMPNHIHCIVVLTQPPPQPVDNPALAHVPPRFHAHMLAEQAKKTISPIRRGNQNLKGCLKLQHT
jgi:putative transposase